MFVHPKVRNIPTDQAVVEGVLAEAVPEIFGCLDGLCTGPYLAGGNLSVADIAVASNLVTYQYIGFDLYRSRFPRLAGLFDRVLQYPAMREALRREQPAVQAMGLRADFLRPVLA